MFSMICANIKNGGLGRDERAKTVIGENTFFWAVFVPTVTGSGTN